MRANAYDMELLAFESLRRDAIEQLDLKPGDTVLDVGCGTGLSFERLQQIIGTEGRIVAIEQCPEMMERARQRVQDKGWTNVTLLTSTVADALIPCMADAALFIFTHDILRQPEAVRRVLLHLKPHANVVAVGLNWASPWEVATNCWVLMAALYSVTSLEGLAAPWSLLADQLGTMEVQQMGGLFTAVKHGAAVLANDG
ncbi:methyltransferase domain-containing protein [Rhodoferax sp. GW822-FHT02A01]|uniref:class I SAM-dependent methyltransferase n=1 Tax=Rhodoferax sp. GW822-FHT02A01 TaxID=3141537 RepID=UPI00315D3BCD